jgi:nucleotide-binding universal stress UspA family protein
MGSKQPIVGHWEATQMFDRILVPLDGTPRANAVLPLVRAIALATSASVHLVRVLPGKPTDHTPHEHRQALEQLVGVKPELTEGVRRVTETVRYGDPAEEIRAEAEAHGANLIVMSTRGRAALERVLLGSVADKLVGRTTAPILLNREGGPSVSKIERLMVALDGSAESALALIPAMTLASAVGATLVLARVTTPMPAPVLDPTLGIVSSIPVITEQEAEEETAVYLGAQAERIRGTGLAVDWVTRTGDAARSLAELAEEADVDAIVMSTQALHGVARLVLGSVADHLVHRAKRPVLLVTRPPRRA